MGKTSLNDLVYSFEPLKIVTPDPDYKMRRDNVGDHALKFGLIRI